MSQLGARRAPHSIYVLVAAIVALQLSTQSTSGFQSGSEQQHGVDSSAVDGRQSSGPMAMSMGAGESSGAALESAAVNSDDLLAAESSQAPDVQADQQHKAFTSGQMMRQDPQQHAAVSVAPVFIAPQQPQQQPQQQQHHHQQQQQQQQMFPHMAARLQPPHKANFNPFMAAALAGNYGPAQQQIAAAALHAQQQGGQVGPAPGHHPQQQHMQPPPPPPQQQQQQQQQHLQPHPHPQHVGHAHPQHMAHLMPQVQAGPPAAAAPPAPSMVAQESSLRHKVVAPAGPAQFVAPAGESANTIELNELSPAQQSTSLAVASSVQHPVIAPAAASASGQVGVGSSSGQEAQAWPLQAPDIPKIVNLEVKCEKNLMKVSVEFDKIFNGVIFSKGHFNQGQCVHVGPQSNKQQAYFDISINSCGTQGNTQNGLYGMGQNTGSGTFFENTIVIQYDPNVQEVYDHARKLRCTWHDQYEKAVTFRPFPVDMLDIVRADFAGDNVGCWMQIQVGKGPWASEVAGIVKIGQTMTMVLAIKDEENKFDMLVRNCFAHDGKRGPIELVDKSGCITRPKLMSRFTKIKNFGSSATVLSYAHFQAFKFPDSMEVHFQCTIQICRHQCPEQCAAGPNVIGGGAGSAGSTPAGETYSESTISGTFNINSGGSASGDSAVHLRKYGSPAASLSRERRDLASSHHHHINSRRWLNGSHHHHHQQKPQTQSVGVNRIIQVVSTGDLAFAVQQKQEQQQQQQEQPLDEQPQASQLTRLDLTSQQICMSSYNFVLALVLLVLILLCSCMFAVSLYVRQRSLTLGGGGGKHQAHNSSTSKLFDASASHCVTAAAAAASQRHVPSKQAIYGHSQFYGAQQ